MTSRDTVAPATTVSAGMTLFYMAGIAILYVGAVMLIYFAWRRPLAYVAVGLPAACFLITQPRLAVYQFIFGLFIQRMILPSYSILLMDISAGLVILAAMVDILVTDRLPERVPRLAVNMLLVLGAMFVAAIFGKDLFVSLRPIGRVAVLVAAFVSLSRLARYLEAGTMLRVYFWLAAGHSLFAAGPFLASGGGLRSFGFAPAVFDELAMIALPIGLSFYLWSERGKGWYYLPGSGLTLVGLLATQSRTPIFFGLLACVVVLIVSFRRSRTMDKAEGSGEQFEAFRPSLVRKRIVGLVGLSFVFVVLAAVAIPAALAAIGDRFERLITWHPGGTFAIRLVLWKWALIAFRDNPLLGIGPGHFRSLGEIYPTLHLTPLQWYLRSLSAHNLVLHYMAETGIVGAAAILALFIRQFRMAWHTWRQQLFSRDAATSLAVFVVGFLFLGTAIVEAGWMWAQTGFIMVFFMAVITRQYDSAGERVAP